MQTTLHHRCLLPACGLLIAAIVVSGCATSMARPAAAPTEEPAPTPLNTSKVPPGFIPVVRYGRYTLVELAPASAQKDLLLQVVDVALPDTRQATVGDALRHVLLRSGYQLCAAGDIAALNALPLPAAHYRLGPVLLRDALLTLAGPAWDLHVDDGARRICFTRVTLPAPEAGEQKPPEPAAAIFAVPGKVETRPLMEARP